MGVNGLDVFQGFIKGYTKKINFISQITANYLNTKNELIDYKAFR